MAEQQPPPPPPDKGKPGSEHILSTLTSTKDTTEKGTKESMDRGAKENIEKADTNSLKEKSGGGTPLPIPSLVLPTADQPVILCRINAPTPYNAARKHRQSGLFSVDDLSIDVSVAALDNEHFVEQSRVRGASIVNGLLEDGNKSRPHHPISLAGSSIGSSSLGLQSDAFGIHQRDRYRPFRRKFRRFRRKYKGCIFAFISSLASSLASFFVHELTHAHNGYYKPSYLLFWRYVGVLFPGIFIVLFYRYFKKNKIFDTVWPLKEKEQIKKFSLSVARTVVDTLAILLNYKAFEYLLQSETSTILNSKPVIVQLLAHFTLGESWGVTPIIMSIVAAIGVVIISKPPFLLPNSQNTEGNKEDFVHDRLPGILCAMASMLLAAVVYCILRYLKDVHYSVFSLFIGTGGVIFGLSMSLGMKEFVEPKNGLDGMYLCFVASLVCISSITIVIALQNEEAFVVSLVRSCDVIFSFIWEMTLPKATPRYPDWYSGGGALIIMFCVIVIFFRKYISHQDPESKLFKTFHFLTK